MTNEEARKYIEESPLDPARWREVGKARGWKNGVCGGCHKEMVGDSGIENRSSNGGCGNKGCGRAMVPIIDEWKDHALHYFETLLTAPEKIKEYWTSLP